MSNLKSHPLRTHSASPENPQNEDDALTKEGKDLREHMLSGAELMEKLAHGAQVARVKVLQESKLGKNALTNSYIGKKSTPNDYMKSTALTVADKVGADRVMLTGDFDLLNRKVEPFNQYTLEVERMNPVNRAGEPTIELSEDDERMAVEAAFNDYIEDGINDAQTYANTKQPASQLTREVQNPADEAAARAKLEAVFSQANEGDEVKQFEDLLDSGAKATA